MNEWLTKVDFAWMACDSLNNLGLFYTGYENIPNDIFAFYSKEKYGALTDFIIDELPFIGEGHVEKYFAESDVKKGFYVYEYNPEKSGYERVGVPGMVVATSSLSDFDDLIVSLPGCRFLDDELIKK